MIDNNQISNSEAVPPLDLLKISLLRRRASVINAVSNYFDRKFYTGHNPNVSDVSSKLYILYMELDPALRRWITDAKELSQLRSACKSKDINVLIDAFMIINNLLDDKKIIRIDMTPSFDTTNIEEENYMRNT
jgi:hypothetical protein